MVGCQSGAVGSIPIPLRALVLNMIKSLRILVGFDVIPECFSPLTISEALRLS